jgi:hypothetical protein
MDNDRPDKSPIAATRADAFRERFRRTQAIAAQAARARAAGAPPSEEEAARLVAEFQAQGGRVTICPPADDEPPDVGTKR